MTHDEMIAVIAAHKNGQPIERKLYGESDKWWRPVERPDWNFHDCDYRIAPDPIAPGHNPEKLTVSQVGEGYRLLDDDEVAGEDDVLRELPEIEAILCDGSWAPEYRGNRKALTYRTRLSREELAALRNPPKIAPGFNPHKLTEAEVEVDKGWRLLSEEEVEKGGAFFSDTQYLDESDQPERPSQVHWRDNANIWGAWPCRTDTLRTQHPPGHYLPKPKRRVPLSHADLMPGTLIRQKNSNGMGMVLEIGSRSFNFCLNCCIRNCTYDSPELFKNYERSTDGGKTWLPCYK